jgi:hypothetical protein
VTKTSFAHRLVDLGLDAFAAKRLTRLMVDDALLAEAREAFWKRYPPESAKLGYLLTCHACTSMWAAALVRSPLVPRRLRDLFALSELVLAIQRMVDD